MSTDYPDVMVRSRGRLPHWESNSATYFVTFRLADSLPQTVLHSFEFERADIPRTARQQGRELTVFESRQLERLYSKRISDYLDTGSGACYLAKPDIADLVAEAFRHFDGERYRLEAWCVMPNHVHVLFSVCPGQSLAKILFSWKSFTARHAKTMLKVGGPFWQREYYDHLIRNGDDFRRCVRYIINNPVRANLKDWRWVWVREVDY